MQTISFENNTPVMGLELKTQNQFSLPRRDKLKCRAIYAAVLEWEATLPGRAQDRIALLVAKQWEKQNGRGISVNKQNLYRYLKNEGGSEKYTSYVIQLSAAIVAAMPLEIARKHGWRRDEKTDAELMAISVKEDAEAYQAVLLGLPLAVRVKELLESISAKAMLLPVDVAGPLLASISAVAPQFF